MKELKQQADKFYSEKNFAKAIELYQQILGLKKEMPFIQSLLYNLGMCFQGEKNFKAAIDVFELLLQNHPSHQKARDQLEFCYQQIDEGSLIGLIDFEGNSCQNISQIFMVLSVGSRIMDSATFVVDFQAEFLKVQKIINLVRKHLDWIQKNSSNHLVLIKTVILKFIPSILTKLVFILNPTEVPRKKEVVEEIIVIFCQLLPYVYEVKEAKKIVQNFITVLWADLDQVKFLVNGISPMYNEPIFIFLFIQVLASVAGDSGRNIKTFQLFIISNCFSEVYRTCDMQKSLGEISQQILQILNGVSFDQQIATSVLYGLMSIKLEELQHPTFYFVFMNVFLLLFREYFIG